MQLWMMNGGNDTMRSIEQQENEEKSLRSMESYFADLPYYLHIERERVPDLLISHAGINVQMYNLYQPDWEKIFELAPSDPNSFLWTRDELADIEGISQVVGHTPMTDVPRKAGNNYYIDSGCFLKRAGMGQMTAVQFALQDKAEPVDVYRQSNIDF
jgi:hypothetical protein